MRTVLALRDATGLTAAQLGRLFGVSRRSINNWLSGNPMAPHHEDRLSHLCDVTLAISAATADDRRAALLDSSHGTSIFQQLVDQVSGMETIHSNPLATKDLF